MRRLGKRVVFVFDEDLFAVLHLMIAGRLRWREPGAAIPGKLGLAAFDFAEGTLILTEAGSRKQASLHVVRGDAAVAAMDPGGADVFTMRVEAFAAALRGANHTLKRSLTDPHLFSGIGNAYSDEILHAARLSPVKLTQSLTDAEVARLFDATRDVLQAWTARLQQETGDAFPEKGDRLPPRDGGARPLPAAVPALRRAGAADRVRAQRGELLRRVPDRRQAARRSRAISAVARGLAADARGSRAAKAGIQCQKAQLSRPRQI